MADHVQSRNGGRSWSLVLAACLASGSCAAEPETDPDELDEPESPWPLPRTCAAPSGLGSPSTIEEVVALVDALPKPTTLPCVLESLVDRGSTNDAVRFKRGQPHLGEVLGPVFFEGVWGALERSFGRSNGG